MKFIENVPDRVVMKIVRAVKNEQILYRCISIQRPFSASNLIGQGTTPRQRSKKIKITNDCMCLLSHSTYFVLRTLRDLQLTTLWFIHTWHVLFPYQGAKNWIKVILYVRIMECHYNDHEVISTVDYTFSNCGFIIDDTCWLH